MTKSIKDSIAFGQIARLIPVVADSKKEERATSSLLASFMVVPAFASEVLSDLGAPMGKRSVIECYTEVCFKSEDKAKLSRPDGLIIVSSGSKTWSALVESKIGNFELRKDQVEEYLDLAKAHGIDAVITISNQYAITSRHHPIAIAKQKLKGVEVFHYSWLSLIAKAVLITDNKKIEDPEQAYILSELIRFYNHDSSGVTQFTRMDSCWKDVCTSVMQKAALSKSSAEVQAAVGSWQQLLKYLALDLSMKIGQPVSVFLSRSKVQDQELGFQEDCAQLVSDHCLTAEFDIPNAASRIVLHVDIVRRTLNLSMRLDAPKDKSRATASINWFTRQLKGKPNTIDLVIRAHWPRRRPTTTAALVDILEKPEKLVPEGVSEIPSSIEVTRVVDLMARFKGAQTFVEDATKNFSGFYHDVGQHLVAWVAKAPKVKENVLDTTALPTIMSGANDIVMLDEGEGIVEPKEQVSSFLGRFMKS